MMSDYEFEQLIDRTIRDYVGDGSILMSAIGALVVGRSVGWQVVYLVHSEPTMRKYQAALGINFKDVLPKKGVYSKKSMAFVIVESFNNFWQVIQGRDKSVSREQRSQLSNI